MSDPPRPPAQSPEPEVGSPQSAEILLVGTANRHKVAEITAVLSGLVLPSGRPLSIVGAEALRSGDPVEESGTTFEENARLKALQYAARALRLPAGQRPRWVVADDSGLSVDALDGAPGVRSARYAGVGATDRDNNRKLLEALKDVPANQRGALFVCTIACVEVVDREGALSAMVAFVAEGHRRGQILLEERGTGGFGYDPLFLVPELGKTFAELSQEEKNGESHRGHALAVFREKLAAWISRS